MSSLDTFDVTFRLTARPQPVNGRMRVSWKVGLVVLALYKCCRGSKGSIPKLHAVTWPCIDTNLQEEVLDFVKGTRSGLLHQVRYDPSLDRAIEFAVGEGLVTINDKAKLELSTTGIRYAETINSEEGLFFREKIFLSNLGKRFSGKDVRYVLEGGYLA